MNTDLQDFNAEEMGSQAKIDSIEMRLLELQKLIGEVKWSIFRLVFFPVVAVFEVIQNWLVWNSTADWQWYWGSFICAVVTMGIGMNYGEAERELCISRWLVSSIILFILYIIGVMNNDYSWYIAAAIVWLVMAKFKIPYDLFQGGENFFMSQSKVWKEIVSLRNDMISLGKIRKRPATSSS